MSSDYTWESRMRLAFFYLENKYILISLRIALYNIRINIVQTQANKKG